MKHIIPVFTKNQLILFILIAFTIIFAMFFSCSVSTKASQKDDTYTYYKTIEIKSGDSLWSIAVENTSGYYVDTNDYIREVQSINHILDVNDIFVGQCIVVPYYSTVLFE